MAWAKEMMTRCEKGVWPRPDYPCDDRKMSLHVFWELIGDSRITGGQDIDPVLIDLRFRLAALKLSELKKFHKLLCELVEKLNSETIWAIGYLLSGGMSNDSFDYFKAWIVIQGQKVFDSFLRDPEFEALDHLSVDSYDCEDLLFVAEQAAVIAGYDWDGPADLKLKTIKPTWSEKSLPTLLPRLYNKLNLHRGARP